MGKRSKMEAHQQYVFQSQPRPVRSGRKKYRERPTTVKNDSAAFATGKATKNIMHDPRVIRGSTYAHTYNVRQVQGPQSNRLTAERPTKHSSAHRRERRPKTPEPVPGRQHVEVQTQEYYEDLQDRPVEHTISTQTDTVTDRPTSPLFKPQPFGVSKATWIDRHDLFDFDQEVEPILEVLVGKTVDMALMEVLEEQELQRLAALKNAFEQKRNAMIVTIQRAEAAEQRRLMEKAQRLEQATKRRLENQQQERQQSAGEMAKEYLMTATNNIFTKLENQGHFYDPVKREVEDSFLPWLWDQAAKEITYRKKTQALLDGLLARVR